MTEWRLLERNDQTINNYNSIISLALLANMDIQPVLTYDGLIAYVTKYMTKKDNPDIFQHFRDDTGKPTDGDNTISRSEIPINQQNVQKLVTKIFTDQIKYSMISSPELYHHLLHLPPFFSSRTFARISLQSELNKLLMPEEITKENQNANVEGEQALVKENELTTYEKRREYNIPESSKTDGVTEETITNMSFFLFHKTFFVRKLASGKKTLCRKSKPPIIMLKPYELNDPVHATIG